MTLLKVNDTTLARDIQSKGLVETDRKKANAYQVQKKIAQAALQAEQSSQNLENRIDSIEVDIKDIKEMLQRLIGGIN